jgi:hypothetical protein
MNDEDVGFIFIRTHQNSTAISTPVFDRRILCFQQGRGVWRSLNDKRWWHHLEDFLRQGGHCPMFKCPAGRWPA